MDANDFLKQNPVPVEFLRQLAGDWACDNALLLPRALPGSNCPNPRPSLVGVVFFFFVMYYLFLLGKFIWQDFG